jgi:hypothetical protein
VIDWRDRISLLGGVIYSVVVTIGFLSVCLALYFREIPATQKDIALVLFGGLLVAFKDVGSFWTGSTSSSQKKDQTIAKTAEVASAAVVDTAKAAAAKVP